MVFLNVFVCHFRAQSKSGKAWGCFIFKAPFEAFLEETKKMAKTRYGKMVLIRTKNFSVQNTSKKKKWGVDTAWRLWEPQMQEQLKWGLRE